MHIHRPYLAPPSAASLLRIRILDRLLGGSCLNQGYDALTDLKALDAFLSSDNSPEHCKQLSDLDGFLTGIICSPKLTLLSEWLPVAFGSQDITDIPPEFIKLVMKRYNEIAAALNSEPAFLEPIFWQGEEGRLVAMDWCEGFMDAFALYRDGWDELMRTEQGRDWMFPILAHLFDEDGKSLVGATEEELDTLLASAAEEIPETVPRIFTFFQLKRAPVQLH